MKIEVKTGHRREKHYDRFGMPGERTRPCAIVVIDGIPCYHECNTMDEARALVIRFAYALGLE